MSNSWRGPAQEHARALERGRPSQAAEPVQAKLAPTAAPLAPAKPIVAATAPARPAAPVATVKSPQAQIEVRTHTDPPVKQAKARIDWTKAKAAAAAGTAWLGGVTLKVGAILRDQWQIVARRLRGKVKGELPRQTVVIGFAALAVVMLSIFWFTRGDGTDPAPLKSSTPVDDANLAALAPVEKTVTPPSQRNPAAGPGQNRPETAQPPNGVAPGQPRPKLSRLAVDPREKNKRYFTLASYSAGSEDYVLPLLEFLWSQGVEAAAIQAHNSKYFEVVALQPFTREELNSGAHKQYEDSLRAIGLKWKAASGGTDNLQGMYTKVYSGTAAKLSITKAN